MNLSSRFPSAFVGLTLVLAGCSTSPPAPQTASSGVKSGDDATAVALLKHSMDVYAAMPAFTADTAFSMSSSGLKMPATQRQTSYQKPNLFKVVSSNPMGFQQTSVSDGKQVLEFDNMTGQAPRKEAAPATIAAASSMQMKHPMFCGTVLYQFFGGSANYSHLVDATKGTVTLGAKEKSPNGEPAQIVKFYGPDQFGHVETLIGEKTGYVYRIKYDSEPTMKALGNPETLKGMKSSLDVVKDPKVKAGAETALSMTPDLGKMSLITEEAYSNIATPASLPAKTFDLVAPKGSKPAFDLSALTANQDKPPVPLGSAAPDFSVTGLDGKSISLASMKGHPILLDFWATWCGPCVASLPHTQELFTKGKSLGLQVVAISDEKEEIVSKFIKENKYTFPTALDTTKAAGNAYKTEAIPTTVVIDAQGKLVAYIVGGGQDEAIKKALAKVGVPVD